MTPFPPSTRGAHRCDPAPFYLFDEIDAALDPQYRTAVAALLRLQANDARNPAMFVVTTFHPQVGGWVCVWVGGCTCLLWGSACIFGGGPE